MTEQITLTRLVRVAGYIVSGYAHAEVSTIGSNLKRVRGERDQKEIAERMGEPQSRLSNWENDRYETINLKTLLRLAWAYGCSIEDLVVGLDSSYDAERAYKASDPPAPSKPIASDEANDILLAMTDEDRAWATGVLRRLLKGAPREVLGGARRRLPGERNVRRSR